ncbi:unnamed protein product [Peronospora belbahrii]|uniref:Uncharacterized protein n=1 Tax=Peronospora belbahrii TaxID=622444 RepID=A0ABN8D514_9STRA|nr:unnamed protein product [Peronospora belbahrii]
MRRKIVLCGSLTCDAGRWFYLGSVAFEQFVSDLFNMAHVGDKRMMAAETARWADNQRVLDKKYDDDYSRPFESNRDRNC